MHTHLAVPNLCLHGAHEDHLFVNLLSSHGETLLKKPILNC